MPYIAVSQLFTGADIFIIPTFQRPYSWEQPQWDDLHCDLTQAAARLVHNHNAFHYFGPIHTISVSPEDIDDDNSLFNQYTDPQCNDIQVLRDHAFQANGALYNVHLVIDGQQRLVTLFALLESCAHSPTRYLDIPEGPRVPKLILNPAADHAHWRAALHLNQNHPPIEVRAQERLWDMFGAFNPAPFPPNGNVYGFLIGQRAKVMWIELPLGATLAPFLTLNDRGKDLTKLERVKSLAMEADENGHYGLAQPLNQGFGKAYRSIDLKSSLLDEDALLRQLAIMLWEGKTGVAEEGPIRVHDESLEAIYQRYRSRLSEQVGNQGQLVNLVRQLNQLVTAHDQLATQRAQALVATPPLGIPSFVNALFPNAPGRSGRDDYQMVLDSLGVQSKQLAVLLALRGSYNIDWHDSLGMTNFRNATIKRDLLHDYRKYAPNIPDGVAWKATIHQEIMDIPEDSERTVTPLYLAELLRLIVGNAGPGTFMWTWRYAFGGQPVQTQDFLNAWMNYLVGFNRRHSFIIWRIARNTRWENNSQDLRYLLKEFECCLPNGMNAHRVGDHEIEHFFARAYAVIDQVGGHGFNGNDDYENNFLDRPGNKLWLSRPHNRQLNVTPPLGKVQAYAGAGFTKSAQQIGHDLQGQNGLNLMRDYVMLRQLRLAAFAAKRF